MLVLTLKINTIKQSTYTLELLVLSLFSSTFVDAQITIQDSQGGGFKIYALPVT
ncbi:hypothetical protein [Marinomonas sp. 2405UD68-3]|uniref:hypothetical protein n=1 Tax=Marinomonas sp. 2405UD68-3 TaxID=3391835 RepID=UPI0039C9D594